MLAEVADDPDLLKCIITGEEMWVYGYDVETKKQRLNHPNKIFLNNQEKKAHQVRSNVKVLHTLPCITMA